ncbi:hypothetical protein CSC2_30020 [Clostridium zeae]|uniref:Uncharacterized protein n=1 Tax=Clostridium zeae TaxID=2759022 RepID=A0ABQ1ECF0_9CLOT|nr:hypothetical protein [Clostridium zeae]GFZ32476.1 hypothetical protein CSC2_30020 [Clostridium zeae]
MVLPRNFKEEHNFAPFFTVKDNIEFPRRLSTDISMLSEAFYGDTVKK